MSLTHRFEIALQMASRVHAAQRRKGGDIPYICHPLAVAGLVIEAGGDEDAAIAALLHDAVEDQGGLAMLETIRQAFGDAVAEIVDECSDTHENPKPPWRRRKEAYLSKIPGKSAAARLIGAADAVHNARALVADYRDAGESLWARFNGGRDGTLWYYRRLIEALDGGAADVLVAELRRTVETLEHLAGRSITR